MMLTLRLLIPIIFIVAIVIALKKIFEYIKTPTNVPPKAPPVNPQPPIKENNQPGDPTIYRKKWLFTMNEKPVYHCIKKVADEKNMRVFAKARLLDLIEPKNSKDKSALWRIQAKHVDFVITTDNLIATHVIELDDNSHNTTERQQRDQFVDAALKACGYKVLHIRGPQEEAIRTFLST